MKRDDGTISERKGTTEKPCYRCGGGHDSYRCNFKEAECQYCRKMGHIDSVCRRKRKDKKPRRINATTSNAPEETLSEYSFQIACVQDPHSNPLIVTVSINNTPINMEVDTGATLSIMSYSTFLASWPQDRRPESLPMHISTCHLCPLSPQPLPLSLTPSSSASSLSASVSLLLLARPFVLHKHITSYIYNQRLQIMFSIL